MVILNMGIWQLKFIVQMKNNLQSYMNLSNHLLPLCYFHVRFIILILQEVTILHEKGLSCKLNLIKK